MEKKPRPKKIAVCVPWNTPFVWTYPVFNLMNLNRPDGVDVKFVHGEGRDAAGRHMWSVWKGIEWGATHICFLSADQLHPMDILEKFCSHMEDGWTIATAAIPVRGKIPGFEKPFSKIAWKWKNPSKTKPPRLPSMDEFELIDPADGPYQEICVVGTGALMIDVDLLYAMKKPWFVEMPADINARRIAAMDTTFTWRLTTEAKGRMICDLTIDIQHLDVFPIDETYSDRFSDWEEGERKNVLCRYLDKPSTKLPDEGIFGYKRVSKGENPLGDSMR